jgi:hypothetical protein
VAAALTLLLDGPDVPGPPLVTDLWGGSATDPDDQVVGLDYAYRRLLDQLTLLRGRAAAAGASTVATRVRIRRGQPPEPLPGTAAEVAAEEKRERKLKAAARHWSAAIDEFSRSKEVVQASYRTAAGARDAQRAICAAPGATETDQATAQAGVIAADAQVTKAAGALARLLARGAAISRGLTRAAWDEASETPDGPLDPPDGLLELRADPLGGDARILFAVEPAGTITLLAVLESQEAVRRDRDTAIDLASGLLAEIREHGWPQPHDKTEPNDKTEPTDETEPNDKSEPAGNTGPADTTGPADKTGPGSAAETDELAFADSGTFLHEIYPDGVPAVRARATALARARRLAGLRRDRGLSVSELARRSGLSLQQVAEIEFGGLRQAAVAAAAAYVAGLGGHLVLTADLGPDGRTEISG